MHGARPLQKFAEDFGITTRQCYKLMSAGKLKTIKIGVRRYVPNDEAERIQKEGTEG